MATFPPISQTGGPARWQVWGGGITNHEAFAFTLSGTEHNVGALISDVTVYIDQDPFDPLNPNSEPSFNITLTTVDQFANPVNLEIRGNFESDGV
jgi:hypothetical protein